jgi:hypothetical protein
MRDVVCTLLCALGLAGCASTPAPYGNFIGEAPAGYDLIVAQDTARQLATIYPPAYTRFELQQATADAFGTRLTASLRARGYAVRELVPSSGVQEAPAGKEGNPAAVVPVRRLRYVLDRAADLYRVTLEVGDQSMSRAYLPQGDALHPAGAWVRKE